MPNLRSPEFQIIGFPILFAYFAKRVGDGIIRAPAGATVASGVRENPKGETTVESRPSTNEGWGTRHNPDLLRQRSRKIAGLDHSRGPRVPHPCAFFAQGWDSTSVSHIRFFQPVTRGFAPLATFPAAHAEQPLADVRQTTVTFNHSREKSGRNCPALVV